MSAILNMMPKALNELSFLSVSLIHTIHVFVCSSHAEHFSALQPQGGGRVGQRVAVLSKARQR